MCRTQETQKRKTAPDAETVVRSPTPAARTQEGLTFKKTQEGWAEFATMQKAAALKDQNQGQDPQADTVGRRRGVYEPILLRSGQFKI